MKYYIIAGEASGDLHGSNLIKEIIKLDSNAEIKAWGGDKMQEAGAIIVKHFKDLAFMGFYEVLINLSNEIDAKGLGTWITDYLVANITILRNELRAKYNTDKLNDFHCTLVSVLLGEKGGLIAHIGDGAIFGGQASKDKKETNLSNDLFYSLPENGQYSNETFFITENAWIKHLRVTPISSANWICLGTDGGMALAMQNESEVKSGFVAPVIKEIVLSKDRNFCLL